MRDLNSKSLVKQSLTLVVSGIVFVCALLAASFPAHAQDRTLYLHYTHTGETAHITFRKNGRYDQSGLRQLNQFLRDWRRNEPTNMDPALFDLVWQVYQDVGATEPIYVVSAYRAPETNEMLRSKSSGVAKNSRHTMGQAMDFYIPGVQLSKLREAAMLRQVGGVGYYPTSGSPFVHLDTGNVRAWPRMTTAQLRRLFPDGKTLHLGADGTVLSQEGRQFASAQWQKCHSIPCVGNNPNTAPNGRGGTPGGDGNGRTLMDLFFGNEGDDNDAGVAVANLQTSDRVQVTSVSVTPTIAPNPAPRSSLLDFREPAEPPIPLEMPEAVLVAMRPSDEALPGTPTISSTIVDPIQTAALNPNARPDPRALLTDDNLPAAGLLSAYAPQAEPEPDAQRALQMLIERRNAQTPPSSDDPNDPLNALRGTLVTASLSPLDISASRPSGNTNQNALPEIEGSPDLFSTTFAAVEQSELGAPAALVNQVHVNTYEVLPVGSRDVLFYAPEFEQISEAPLVSGQSIAGSQFAVLFEPDEGDFSPLTELGKHCGSMNFSTNSSSALATGYFSKQPTLFTAAL